MGICKWSRWAGALAVLGVSATVGAADFSDVFDGTEGQPDPDWNNEYAFVVDGGAYNAVSPNNNPLAITTIKDLTITEATVQVDMLGARDGGIIVHGQGLAPNGNMEGVLLVVNPNSGFVYWHVTVGGTNFVSYAQESLPVAPGTDLRIVLQITGNTYSADLYQLSNLNFITNTTLVSNTYASGKVGLYDFNGPQKFDNVIVTIPEPASLALLTVGAGLMAWRRRG